MSQIKFENLLGKHISVAEYTTGNSFEYSNFNINNFENKHYSIKSNLNDSSFEVKYLYGMPYKFIFIQTDKNDNIESITVYFLKIIDRQFYDFFNTVYGEPNSILIIDKRTIISEGTINDDTYGFNQYVRKSNIKLKEGGFEDNPLYIIWKKEKYQIKAQLSQQNMSEITFSLLKE